MKSSSECGLAQRLARRNAPWTISSASTLALNPPAADLAAEGVVAEGAEGVVVLPVRSYLDVCFEIIQDCRTQFRM